MRLRLAACTALLLGLCAGPTDARDDPREARIVAHHIEIRFEPATHSFVARDRIVLDPAGGRRLVLRWGELAPKWSIEPAPGHPFGLSGSAPSGEGLVLPDDVGEVVVVY